MEGLADLVDYQVADLVDLGDYQVLIWLVWWIRRDLIFRLIYRDYWYYYYSWF